MTASSRQAPPGALDEIEAIRKLKARYFRTIDTKDWDGFGALFTDDATLDASADAGHVFHGRDEIVHRVREALRDATTVHHGHMPEIDLTGPASARGIWAMYDYVELPRLVLHGYGHYHEEYAKQDGDWRIRASRLVRIRRDVTRR